MTFDANSTTIRLVDDNGGTSAWAYDLQDHQTTMTFHDGATTIDSMDRLIQYQRGTLDSGGASITTPIGLPNTDAQRAYALDGLGNWKNTAFTPEGGASETELRTHNKLNQIVAFGVPTASTPITYDQGNNVSTANPTRGNGNIANDGTLTYMWDALNRLITVTRISDSAVLGTYAYDALGRRIYAGTGPYLYDGQQIVEELVGGTTSLQYVWGQYIDEPVQLNAVQSQGPQSVTGVNYLLSDLLYRSAALTAGDRSILEAYDTDAYGRTLLFSGPGTDSTWFTNDDTQATYSACRYVFTGREYDAATGNYYYRSRYLVPRFGRFCRRDEFDYVDSSNLYELIRSRPTVLVDPLGWKAGRSTGSANNPPTPCPTRHIGPSSSPMPPAMYLGVPAVNAGKEGLLSYQLNNFLAGVVTGGQDLTFTSPADSSISERLWAHDPGMASFKDWFENGAKNFCCCQCMKAGITDKSTYWSGLNRMQYTATTADFYQDVVSLGLGGGSDGYQFGDIRVQWIGSFTIDFQSTIDCASNSVTFNAVIYNPWSVQSLTRNPFTGNPFVNKRLHQVNQEISIEKVGTACE